MGKIDYKYKSSILKTDLPKRINHIDKRTYLNYQDGVIQDNALESLYFDLLNEYDYNDINEARKINKASFYRVRRLQERINNMLINGHCVFCTFTFTDKVLKDTSEDSRRQYVRKYLKQFNCMYVANIDYGSKNEYRGRNEEKRKATEREHYHALIRIDKMPMSWDYGFEWLEHVRVRSSTDKKLSKYISKLTNHAIKESTKRCAIIYSR